MILPGNNEIHLCQAALMRIVEDHLRRERGYNADKLPDVYVVGFGKTESGVRFTVTTDAPASAAGAA